MRTIIWIFIVIFLLTSCKKDQDQDQVIPEITNEWNLIVIVDGLENHHDSKTIGYYNSHYTIVKSEHYYSDGSMTLSEFEYNNDNLVVRYSRPSFGEYRYYYEDGLRIKREFLGTQSVLSSYEVYEYESQRISKTYYYYGDDKLSRTAINYYNGNGIDVDSTFFYYKNDLDSIVGFKRFKYDGSNNLLEEEYWYKKWYSDDGIVLLERKIYDYENNKLKREECIDIPGNFYKYIFEYEYDIIGRKSKLEIYGPDNTLLGYYNITYSSNTEKYIIPEL
jgi:hypothetical protein